MGPRASCPDPSRLRALLAGETQRGEEVTLVDHLDACPACRALLDAWSDPWGMLEGVESGLSVGGRSRPPWNGP